MPTVVEDVLAQLKTRVRGEVDSSARRRAEYSTDASNYRVVPQVVAFPQDEADVLAILEVARETNTPITARGGGTSVAGNAVGSGIVIDFSRHMNKVLEIDPEARLARVQPGVVMSTLQAAAAPYGLRFGPDPSTQNRATFGGMIGNNACGPHAVAYGRTADNTHSLKVVDGQGRQFTAGPDSIDAVPGLASLVRNNLATIRTQFGTFSRQVSGYSLEHLLPENGGNLAKFLVGTEGSLVTVLEATVNLVPVPDSPTIVVLGYPDMPAAADAVPALLAHNPLAVEGLDATLVDVVRQHHGDHAVPALPPGAGWLLVEVGGSTQAEALERAHALAADAGTTAVAIYPAGPEASAIWKIRADGAGLAGRTAAGLQAWPGWEDAAVPPEKLGTYLREFNALMESYGVNGLPYGHFGDGCIHVRIDWPLETVPGSQVFRDFMHDAAKLVASHGGSLSGEHGDGRARGELLPYMYTPEAIDLFEQVKKLFDPQDHLNPGVVVRPAALDADLRRPHAISLGTANLLGKPQGFSFSHDGGDMTNAIHRCVGVGKCRVGGHSGDFMCPSFKATNDEKDSTRGRARVLQELAQGSFEGDYRSPEVMESLDLCLSCKACSADCPAGVDMAQFKSEVLHRAYSGRIRPITHYVLGWLPRWGKAITAVPGVSKIVNTLMRFRPLAKAVLWAGGMDPRREMTTFADTRFSRWFNRKHASNGETVASQPSTSTSKKRTTKDVVLWADSFSESLDPQAAQAMVELLQKAGYTVRIPHLDACCGLTLISTGQLDGAKKELRNTLDVLTPFVEAGIPIVGVEPSCTATLRSDLPELLPEDPRSHALAQSVYTLAELLSAPAPVGPENLELPDLTGTTIVVQPHCHQYSVMGYQTDLALLKKTGATIQSLDGCCGLAGNFGMEKGHYDVSVAVAENALLPALRSAPEDSIYLADGYSCRTQASQLAQVDGVHLAQLLLGK